MATVAGPLCSLSAHGSISKTLTFRRNGKSHVARKYATPTGEPSAAQLAHRSQFATIAQTWVDASLADKLSWIPLAEADNTTPYAAFTKYTWQRVAQDLDPTPVYPPVTPPVFDLICTAGSPAPNPDCTGPYIQIGTYDGQPLYKSWPDLIYFVWADTDFNRWVISNSNPGSAYGSRWRRTGTINGTYNPLSPTTGYPIIAFP